MARVGTAESSIEISLQKKSVADDRKHFPMWATCKKQSRHKSSLGLTGARGDSTSE